MVSFRLVLGRWRARDRRPPHGYYCVFRPDRGDSAWETGRVWLGTRPRCVWAISKLGLVPSFRRDLVRMRPMREDEMNYVHWMERAGDSIFLYVIHPPNVAGRAGAGCLGSQRTVLRNGSHITLS